MPYVPCPARQVECYVDRRSYQGGDDVRFHLSAHPAAAGSSCTIKLVADGLHPITVLEQNGVAVNSHPTPPAAFAAGCGWPVAFEWRVPSDLRSAFIIVTVTLDDAAAREAVAAAERGVAGAAGPGEHFFVVRHSPAAGDPAPVVLVLATNTWNSYNCACSPPPPRPLLGLPA